MKKLFLMATVASLALASCDDVPEPYSLFDPNNAGGNGSGTTGATLYEGTNLNDWSAVTVKGNAWDLGTNYAKATGYANSTTTETEAWLVSPAISLVTDSTEAYVSLEHVIGYVSDASPLTNHTMWISTDFSQDVATATWTQLEYTPKAWATVKDWTFYAADPVSIPSQFMSQSVYVAFKFICGTSSTTWEVKNVKVMAGKAAEVTPDPVQTDYEHLSIADFIAKADANTAYEITGVASALNENYASLDLTEGDAKVYVYKMVDAEGNKVSLSGLGIEAGDTVTVTGKYYKYEKDGNVKHELNPGTYVSHKKGNGGGTTPPVTPSSGDNILANGDFETWADGLPTNWKSASSASSATLSQSEEAHGGKYAVKVGSTESSNKRLAYKELTLKAGTYRFAYYAKGTQEAKTQTKGGYVPVTNGSVGSYTYASSYTDLSNTAWTEVSYDFTLSEQTTVCLVVMNVKTSNYATAQDILVDDATLTTSDGGIVEGDGGDTGGGNTTEVQAISIADFLAKADAATTYRLTGTVANIKNTTYGNFDLVDGDSKIYIYGLLTADGTSKQFESLGVKEGDKLTIEGVYSTYNESPQIKNAKYVSHVSGSGDSGNTGGDNGNTGGNTGGSTDTPATDGMSVAAITSAVADFPSNTYGTQVAADESTWVSWTYGGVTYKGARICKSTTFENNIQVQGNASDAAKQGFIFNATAFSSEIKTVTVVLKVKDSTSAYDPGYSLYAGSAAHPAGDAVEANASDPAYTVADGIRTYTQVFDLSGKNAKFFTIANDKVGALNIDKVIVTLK